MLRLRRALHGLAKVLAKPYSPKNQGKLEAELKAVKKKIVELESLIEKLTIEEDVPDGVFSASISKTIRSNFGNREIQKITLQEVSIRGLR